MRRLPLQVWRQFYAQNSIHKSLLSFFTILLLAAFLFFVPISIHLNNKAVESNSTRYTTQLIRQVSEQLDDYIRYTENVSRILLYDYDVHRFLGQGDEDQLERNKARRRIADRFSLLKRTRSDIYNIGLFGTDGQHILNDGTSTLNPHVNLKDQAWYQSALQSQGNIQVSAPHVQNLYKDHYNWVVTLSRGILNESASKAEGVLAVDLNYKVIDQLCRQIDLGERGYVFIVDRKGQLIYHPQQQLIFSGLRNERLDLVLQEKNNPIRLPENNDLKIMSHVQSDSTGWTIVGVSYASELQGDLAQTLRLYAVLASAFLFVGFLASLFLSYTFTRPIRRLQKAMELAQDHQNLSGVDTSTYPDNEIGHLASSFNHMTHQVNKLMEDKVHEQALKRKNELIALQSQINPHFLYNTLDSIIWMAEDGETKAVVEMTSSLASLLRQSISNPNELVSIRSELSYIRSYLTILKMRYQDKLNYTIEVEDSILDFLIPKLVLQPLVENAVYHGIKYKQGNGQLSLTGGLNPDAQSLTLLVMDNGVGIPAEKLAHLFDKKEEGTGVGLSNVYERLKLYFGEAYGLSLESIEGFGTEARLILPLLKSQDVSSFSPTNAEVFNHLPTLGDDHV